MSIAPGFYYFNGTSAILLRQGSKTPKFNPGVTEPVYTPALAFDGFKNVGNTKTPLVPYPGTVAESRSSRAAFTATTTSGARSSTFAWSPCSTTAGRC
jgi:hypothetical protein